MKFAISEEIKLESNNKKTQRITYLLSDCLQKVKFIAFLQFISSDLSRSEG